MAYICGVRCGEPGWKETILSRLTLRLLVFRLGLSLVAGAVPAVASSQINRSSANPVSRSRPAVNYRALATSRTVERIEVGILGSDEPPIVKKRTLKGDRIDRARSLDVTSIAAITQSDRESCYYAKPSWTRYNGFRKLSSKAWYYIEWCGRGKKVTKVLTLFCGGVAGAGFSYGRCSIRRGSTGHSRVNVSGTWRFPFRVGLYTFITRTMTVSSRHYANGRYSGTWWLYQ